MTRPKARQTDPVIVPVRKRKAPEPVATKLATLVEYAPLTLGCMSCSTARAARPDGVVLWHRTPQGDGECAGAGAPGLPLCAHCGVVVRGAYGSTAGGAVVCHTGVVPPERAPYDCYRLVTVYGEKLGSRRPS